MTVSLGPESARGRRWRPLPFVRYRVLELRLVGLRQLLLGHVGVGHLLVGLQLTRLRLPVRAVRSGASPAPGTAGSPPVSVIGATGLATAGRSGAASSPRCLSSRSVALADLALTSPLTESAFPEEALSASSRFLGDLPRSPPSPRRRTPSCRTSRPAGSPSCRLLRPWPGRRRGHRVRAAPCACCACEAAGGCARLSAATRLTPPATC